MREEPDHDEMFTVEVSDLPRERRPRRLSAIPAAVRSPLERRLPPLAHAARLGVILAALALVCVVALPSLRTLIAVRWPGVVSARESGMWATLSDRPLHLAALPAGASCPTSANEIVAASASPGQGAGPVYVVAPGGASGELRYTPDDPPPNAYGVRDTQSGSAAVTWYIRPDYHGPVLIRGRQLDGRNTLNFSGGLNEIDQADNLVGAPVLYALRLLGDSQYGAPWPTWPAYIHITVPGCYAYQVDGLTFSAVIVFRAALANLAAR